MKSKSSLRLYFMLVMLLLARSRAEAKQFYYDSIPDSLSINTSTTFSEKRKRFAYITQLPRTFANAGRLTFNRNSIPTLSLIAASTLLLVTVDQQINDGINQFSRFIKLESDRKYKTVIGFKLGKTDVKAYEAPRNFNTFLYSVGEGSTSILIYAGLYLHGVIKKDRKSLEVSSQLMQSLLAVGLTTQLMKRISGRESPFVATVPAGHWSPLTNPVVYQSKVPSYDAFPSGHLATMMATTTVLMLNYPKKKWIKPVGYGLMTLVGLAMINNGVHWMSDYPLALGVGYVFGRASYDINKWIKGEALRSQ